MIPYNYSTGNLASKAGLDYTYGDNDHAHAVTDLYDGPILLNHYQYDANGNMIYRREIGELAFNLAYR